MPRNEFDELRIVPLVVIRRHRDEIALSERLQGAEPPVAVIEQPLIGLPVDEREPVLLPVARLLQLGPA